MLAALMLLYGAANAEPPAVNLRTGNHPGFGRMVLDLPAGTVAALVQNDAVAHVALTPAAPVSIGALPRNVVAITASPGGADILLLAGSSLRQSRADGKLILDALDPVPRPASVPTPVSATPVSATPVAAPRVSAPPGSSWPV